MPRKSKSSRGDDDYDAGAGRGTASKSKAAEQLAEPDPLIGTRMRVWWPPTDNSRKTGFAGAYWPVNIKGKRSNGKYFVIYDNGEEEDVLTENLAPDDPPVDFGEESIPLQPGEFCEVSNDSKTDPCAWVGMVKKLLPNGHYMVHYPFHDSEDEKIKPHLIRRVRVLDMEGWCLLKPGQKWKDGDVLSPHELETIKESDLDQHVNLSTRPEANSKDAKDKVKTKVNGNSSDHEEDGADNGKTSRKRALPADTKAAASTRAAKRV